MYPLDAYDSPRDAFSALLGDASFVCPARRVARWWSDAGRPSFLYHYGHTTRAAEALGLGAHHGAEIPFVFGNLLRPSQDESLMSIQMQGLWSSFAAGGAPEPQLGLEWPAYSRAENEGMWFYPPSRMIAAYRLERCDLWDSFQPADPPPDPPTPRPTPTGPTPTWPPPATATPRVPPTLVPPTPGPAGTTLWLPTLWRESFR
jgi:carboxylesterase type B